MKAVLIVHNAAIESDVDDVLESIGVDGFTKFPNTLGKGQLSEPHLDSDVWPGVNCGTLVVTDEVKAGRLMDEVRTHADALEMEVADELWPLPKYHEMLFIK